jgi:transposase
MAHANARTNVFARRLIVERVAAGWPAAHVAEQLGVSRSTVHKWLRRHAEAGDAGLADRSSRPIRMPARTSKRVEKRVLAVRRRRRRGAVVLAAELGMNASTVGRILARHQVPLLAVMDPITGERVRNPRRSSNRYEHPTPGAMIHVDVKKLGKIPAGGGWRLHGRDNPAAQTQDRQDRLRHHRPPRPDRQRHGLPPRHRLGLLGLAAQTPLHQTRLPLDQRQSRTVQPHPAQRMGLRPPLDQQQPPPPRP